MSHSLPMVSGVDQKMDGSHPSVRLIYPASINGIPTNGAPLRLTHVSVWIEVLGWRAPEFCYLWVTDTDGGEATMWISVPRASATVDNRTIYVANHELHHMISSEMQELTLTLSGDWGHDAGPPTVIAKASGFGVFESVGSGGN